MIAGSFLISIPYGIYEEKHTYIYKRTDTNGQTHIHTTHRLRDTHTDTHTYTDKHTNTHRHIYTYIHKQFKKHLFTDHYLVLSDGRHVMFLFVIIIIISVCETVLEFPLY